MKTSVALCTYNGEKFIRQQIDSILDQTKKVDEIVVCDDGSTDSTVSILDSYQEKHPELFKIFINDENLRSVKNFEKAISLCQNEIIFLCDQDDVWMENKVATYCDFFQKNPNIAVLCSNGLGIDDDGEELEKISFWDAPEMLSNKGLEPDFFEITAFLRNIVTGATVAIRKEFRPQILPFPSVESFHHDEWIALIASKQKKLHFLSEKYIKYRLHANQTVGGVFLPQGTESENYLLNYFSFNSFNANFKTYRKILRSLRSANAKYLKLKETSATQKELIEEVLKLSAEKYQNLKTKLRKEFPLQSLFLK